MNCPFGGRGAVIHPENVGQQKVGTSLPKLVQQGSFMCRNEGSALSYKAPNLMSLLFRKAGTVGEKQNFVEGKSLLFQLLVEDNVDQQMRLIHHLVGTL